MSLQKIYVTKYALSEGIIEAEMEVRLNLVGNGKMAFGKFQNNTVWFHNNDFHLTKDEAIIEAEKMRTKKIESLKRQIQKLENRVFNNQ